MNKGKGMDSGKGKMSAAEYMTKYMLPELFEPQGKNQYIMHVSSPSGPLYMHTSHSAYAGSSFEPPIKSYARPPFEFRERLSYNYLATDNGIEKVDDVDIWVERKMMNPNNRAYVEQQKK